MRFPVFDPELLGPLTLVDIPDEEVILRARMDRLKELWAERDPPFGAVYDVENTEFDPIKICQEVSTSFHVNVLSNLNAWGKATTLAFGWGPNLDAIASRYPGGVPRQAGEGDERYRRRIWLSANSFNTAGAEGAYVYWAMTAFPGARDATAVVSRPTPESLPTVVVTVLKEGDDPTPTTAELLLVHRKLHEEDVKPLTDPVSVVAPAVIETRYAVDVWLYPAADGATTVAAIKTALQALGVAKRYLGEDHTEFDIHAAAKLPGVQNVLVREPIADLRISPRQVGVVTDVVVTLKGRAE